MNDPNEGLRRGQRELRERQQRTADGVARVEVRFGTTGFEVTVLDSRLRHLSQEHSTVPEPQRKQRAAEQILATFTAADWRLVRAPRLALALAEALREDASLLAERLAQDAGTPAIDGATWSMTGEQFDAWAREMHESGHGFPYRGTVRATTTRLRQVDEEYAAAAPPRAEERPAQVPEERVQRARTGSWPRAERLAERARVQELVEANLSEADAVRVMAYVGRVEREWGQTLERLRAARQMNARRGEPAADKGRPNPREQLRRGGGASAGQGPFESSSGRPRDRGRGGATRG